MPNKVRGMRSIPKKARNATRPVYNLAGQVIFYGSDEEWRSWVNNGRVLQEDAFPFPYASAVAR